MSLITTVLCCRATLPLFCFNLHARVYKYLCVCPTVGVATRAISYLCETVHPTYLELEITVLVADWCCVMTAASTSGQGSVPMFPGTYVPRYPCSPVPMFPSTYVPRTYVPRYLCSTNLCSPVPIFTGTYVPRFAVNDSSRPTPPRLIFLSLQIDDYSDFYSGSYRVCTLDAGTVFF